MKFSKIVFKPLSPFSRLFTADQLWGQMVWAISEIDSEEEADKFVKTFHENPPFIVSSMMPLGFLPRPILPPFKSEEKKLDYEEERKSREQAKKNKSNKWIPLISFSKIQDNPNAITKIQIDRTPKLNDFKETHVCIRRDTFSAVDNGLYNIAYLTTKDSLVCYLCFKDEIPKNIALIQRIISYWEKVNIGGDRTVGRGSFSIKLQDLDEIENKIFSKNYSSFMSLSRCFGDDLYPIYYNLSIYAGIVGNGLNSKNTDSFFNKQPIVGFEPGSIFSKGSGSLAQGVSTDKRVCSYGYAFPIPFKL